MNADEHQKQQDEQQQQESMDKDQQIDQIINDLSDDFWNQKEINKKEVWLRQRKAIKALHLIGEQFGWRKKWKDGAQ